MDTEGAEIIEESERDALDVIEDGERVSSSAGKDVYRKDDEVVKVLEDIRTEELKRYGAFLPQMFVPNTFVRTEDLSGTAEYDGDHTVVYQDSFTGSLKESIRGSEDGREVGDLVYLLDRMVDENVVMSDPVVENFNYFDDQLKPSDICDEESLKKFPHSFEKGNELRGFREEIDHMYMDAIVSVNYWSDFSIEETAEMFEESSKYIDELELEEGIYVDKRPVVEISEKMLY